jgi:hypothetical protein
MTNHKILSCDERVQVILSTVEEAMTKISRIGTSPTRIPLTEAAIEKRHREAREELRREVARLVRGRGRDMLALVRQYATEAVDTFGEHEDAVSAVPFEGLLAVIDAGFVAEDEPVAGERCPLCERGMTEHTRIDLYGTDAFVCSGATRDGVVVSIAHPQALARLHDAAQREAQRQFDELTQGSEARRKAEDYAAILDALAAVPREQLEGIEWTEKDGDVAFADVIAQLLQKGPLLERERLEAVIRDAVRQSLRPLKLKVVHLASTIYEGDDVDSEVEYAEAVAGMVANLLKGLFPVRVEYVSQEESERVERMRKEPRPPLSWNAQIATGKHETLKSMLGGQPPTPILEFPMMVEGQTHWLIGSDYGLYYKVDAEGRVTRLENEHAASYAPEDVQSGESYTTEPVAGGELVTAITTVSDEPSVQITDPE